MRLFQFVLLLMATLIVAISIFAADKKNSFIRQVVISLQIQGDLNLKLDGSGALGAANELTAEPESSDCQWTGLVREVLYRKKNSVEIFLTQNCTKDGIKSKTSWPKMTVAVDSFSDVIKVQSLNEEVKAAQIQITELQISRPKKN